MKIIKKSIVIHFIEIRCYKSNQIYVLTTINQTCITDNENNTGIWEKVRP